MVVVVTGNSSGCDTESVRVSESIVGCGRRDLLQVHSMLRLFS